MIYNTQILTTYQMHSKTNIKEKENFRSIKIQIQFTNKICNSYRSVAFSTNVHYDEISF